MSLYRTGMSFREVAEAIDRSVAFTHRIVRRELSEIAADRRALAGLLADELIERERLLIREAIQIVTERCPCRIEESTASSCSRCQATGYAYPAKVRLQAMDRARHGDEMLARIAGLNRSHVDIVVAGANDDELLELEGEELDTFVALLAAPLRSLESPAADG